MYFVTWWGVGGAGFRVWEGGNCTLVKGDGWRDGGGDGGGLLILL